MGELYLHFLYVEWLEFVRRIRNVAVRNPEMGCLDRFIVVLHSTGEIAGVVP
jgi:hypothetical protein